MSTMSTLSIREVAEFGVEPLEGESRKAFKAFREFLALSPPRLVGGMEAFSEDKGYRLSSVQKWFHDNGWAARAAGFDGRFAGAQLEMLLESRLGMVVKTVRDSLEDARRLREAVMSNLDRRNLSITELLAMITARMELDAWVSEILNVLQIVSEERGDGEGQEDMINRVRKAMSGVSYLHIPYRGRTAGFDL